jgi:hypothetical protein
MTLRAVGLALVLLASGCAVLGQGEGEVRSDALYAKACWSGPFDLNPDFFAAIPFRDTLQIRVQRGDDRQEVSDSLLVLVDEVTAIRSVDLGEPILVGLPQQLVDEIAPGVATGLAPRVGMSLALQSSCHNQNVVLYALRGTITFGALFSGDPNEEVGSEKLTDARFEVEMADPRDASPGTLDVEASKISRVTGSFSFHFQRGQPGQPFP